MTPINRICFTQAAGIAHPIERPSLYQKICAAYTRAVLQLIEFLDKRGFDITSRVIGTMLIEPGTVLRAAFEWLLYGLCKTPHFSNVNPDSLKPHQWNMQPVLCLHGNYHGQSAFTGIARALKNSFDPAIFTVKLPHGDFTQLDRTIVDNKIEEIKALYRRHGMPNIKVNIVGHSRGAYLGFAMSHHLNDARMVWRLGDFRQDIDKVIMIGDHQTADYRPFQNKFLEINGTEEILLDREDVRSAREKAAEDPLHRLMIPGGHLSLLYSPKTYAAVDHWLRG